MSNKNNPNPRNSGAAVPKHSYINEFLVACPKCRKSAVVAYEGTEATLTCEHCKHTEKSADLVRYAVTVKRNCETCGKRVEKTIPESKEKVEELAIPCPHCGTVHTYKPWNEQYLVQYRSAGKTDTAFNLPLWFQYDVRGHLFWAYNHAHMAEIQQYVLAMPKERHVLSRNPTIERLPNFVKEEKNRETLIRVIENLLKK